jgi:LmbE family N-acetylglucosaminyl deacetylase
VRIDRPDSAASERGAIVRMTDRVHRVPGTLIVLAALWTCDLVATNGVPQDRGASDTWQMLLKLQTTASVMHVAAHPDEEPGGLMAWLSRHGGARVASLTLNRGEAGDNAIGSAAFDALGLLRTEELFVSNRYYGVDEQYFTTLADFGFTKRPDEAFEKWGRRQVLRDVVRIIRSSRPFVLVSRFQGSARDGHGSSSASSLVMREAFEVAADPQAFRKQIRDGVRRWQPLKVYIGGMHENQDWTIRVDPGIYSGWLGRSYSDMARRGLAFQRSSVSPTNSNRHYEYAGPVPEYYKRVGAVVSAGAKETSFFDGIDTSIRGLFKALQKPEPAEAAPLLAAIEAAVQKAVARFTLQDPAATVPALAEGLAATRTALDRLAGADPVARFLLQVKAQQFQDAINAALALKVVALAQPAGVPDPTGPFAEFLPPPTMAAPVPGLTFEVRTRVTNRGTVAITPTAITLETDPGWTVTPGEGTLAPLETNASAVQRFTVTLAPNVPLRSRPYFTRASIQEARYTLSDPTQFGRPAATPSAVAVVRYRVAGEPVEIRQVVQRREAQLPYGDALRELRVVPALAVSVAPSHAVVPVSAPTKQVPLTVDLVNNHHGTISGALTLTVPAGWQVTPTTQPFTFQRPGERAVHRFTVTIPTLADQAYAIEVVATAQGRRYTQGYELIDARDLELRYLYRPATVQVRGLDVTVPPHLRVGYVMGVGDQVPAAIAQLGYPVTLLDAAALATGDLSQFDTIMTGTRAYAVRADLHTSNQRLLEYVQQGGNLVVLYNTQELEPGRLAPFPGEHGPRAEEVSEEDAPVRILAPTAQVFTWPNRITAADFDGWVEQRGSKFWAAWDAAYTPMLETFDQGQAPQRGGWLQARYGQGTYSYVAYAFHRQLPYGVPGAYRLLANLLALGQTPTK